MLLERGPDLARLTAHIGALQQRAGGAVLVEGPPGIGKTALLAEALAGAGELPVLRARGSELETALAFGGVRQLFTAALRRLPEADRTALLTGPASLAASVLGFSDGTPDALSDPLHGLYWLAADLAERTPLIVAIDDLHWLDEESRRFVAYLVPRLEEVPLLVLATTRPGEPVDGFEVMHPAPLS